MSEQQRWQQAESLLRGHPCSDDISAEFLIWAVQRGVCLSDPLKDEFTFAAAVAGWDGAQIVAADKRLTARAREIIEKRGA